MQGPCGWKELGFLEDPEQPMQQEVVTKEEEILQEM